jgi:hypothetical protein
VTLCVDMVSAASMAASVLSALAFMAALSIGFQAPSGHVQRRDHALAPARAGRSH